MTPRSFFAACGTVLLLLLLAASNIASAHHHEECEQHEHEPLDTYVSATSPERRSYVNPPPPLRPGQMSQLRWADDGEPVHDFAYRIGLPPSLRREVYDYAERTGIVDVIKSLVMGGGEGGEEDDYNLTETAQEDGNRLVTMRNGMRWYFNRPGEHFHLKSNQWWADPADERGHEDMLKILAKGGFDTVLEAIGERFEHVDGLAVQGVGFIGVSRCTEHHFHQDFFDREGRMFGVLVPIVLAEEDLPPSERQPELAVETRYGDGYGDDGQGYGDGDGDGYSTSQATERGLLKYEYETAFMTGDGFWHSTNTVDYQRDSDFRLTLSVFIADVTDYLVDEMARDETALYVQGQADWLYAQRGRHWTRTRTSTGGELQHSLREDGGRERFHVRDRYEACGEWAKEGSCDANARRMYKVCPVSCGVFMDDGEYSDMIRESRKK